MFKCVLSNTYLGFFQATQGFEQVPQVTANTVQILETQRYSGINYTLLHQPKISWNYFYSSSSIFCVSIRDAAWQISVQNHNPSSSIPKI